MEEKKEKTNKTKKWLIPVIVCALVLVSVGGYFIYQNVANKDSNYGGSIFDFITDFGRDVGKGKYYGDYWVSEKGDKLVVLTGSGEATKVVEEMDKIKVHFDPAGAYKEKHVKFWGRPIVGIDENGNFELGKWELLVEKGNYRTSDSRDYYVHGRYAEFGFSFDIVAGTDWPYSDIFWTVDKGHPKEINIDWGGTTHSADITIKVDGNTVVKKTDCDKHSEKSFN